MLQSTDPERIANKEGSCNIRCFRYFNNKQSKIKIMKFISLTRLNSKRIKTGGQNYHKGVKSGKGWHQWVGASCS